MKRHESLVPLSRDHHFGLIMAQRLILGRATNPRADWPADRAQQVPRLIEFFKSDLHAHFEIEEAHVFPAAGRSLADGGRQVEALIADHDAMRAMIRGLAADPASGLDERLPAWPKSATCSRRTSTRKSTNSSSRCRPPARRRSWKPSAPRWRQPMTRPAPGVSCKHLRDSRMMRRAPDGRVGRFAPSARCRA